MSPGQGGQYSQNPVIRASREPKKPNDQVAMYVQQLFGNEDERTAALEYLSKEREKIPEIAIYIWYSSSIMSMLLSEIVSIYPYLLTNNLNKPLSNRVYKILALLQSVAGHDDTRIPFVHANIPVYLFPFLHQTGTSQEAEFLKLTSLGIIGSLVKAEQPEIIDYLLQAEFVPLCLRILKFSQEIPRTVAAFIIHKILSDSGGAKFISSQKDKFDTLLGVMNKVLLYLSENFTARLSKHVVASYEILLKMPEYEKVLTKKYAFELSQIKVSPKCDEAFSSLIRIILDKILKIYPDIAQGL